MFSNRLCSHTVWILDSSTLLPWMFISGSNSRVLTQPVLWIPEWVSWVCERFNRNRGEGQKMLAESNLKIYFWVLLLQFVFSCCICVCEWKNRCLYVKDYFQGASSPSHFSPLVTCLPASASTTDVPLTQPGMTDSTVIMLLLLYIIIKWSYHKYHFL